MSICTRLNNGVCWQSGRVLDYASIVYMDENRLLGQSSNPDKTYVEDIMPAKIELNMRYINHPTLFEYFKLIVLTIFKIVR